MSIVGSGRKLDADTSTGDCKDDDQAQAHLNFLCLPTQLLIHAKVPSFCNIWLDCNACSTSLSAVPDKFTGSKWAEVPEHKAQPGQRVFVIPCTAF